MEVRRYVVLEEVVLCREGGSRFADLSYDWVGRELSISGWASSKASSKE